LNLHVSFLALIFLLSGCGRLHSRDLQTETSNNNPHSATISWAPSASPVAGYNVYRTSPPGGPVKLTPKIISATQYTDRTVEAGHTYIYFVTSVDSRGMESSPSMKATVTIPTTVTPPAQQ